MHRRKKKELSKRDNSRKNIKKGKRRKELSLKTKRILWVALIILAIIVLIFAINLAISTNRWKRMATEMTANEGSVVIDTDGTEIAELGCERKIINVDNIPDNLKNAYVSIEDERFYKHHGVDIKRTGAAILSYVVHFGSSSYGGSTITQQLVKNLTGDSSDSIFRKVREWWKAWQLETSLDKDEILEAYLNVIYVGPNTYGVGAGAKWRPGTPAPGRDSGRSWGKGMVSWSGTPFRSAVGAGGSATVGGLQSTAAEGTEAMRAVVVDAHEPVAGGTAGPQKSV